MIRLGLRFAGMIALAGLWLAGTISSQAQQPPAPTAPPRPPLPQQIATPPPFAIKPVVGAATANPAVGPVTPAPQIQQAPHVVPIAQPMAPTTPPNALVFDSETKEYKAKPGDALAPFMFWVTNTHSAEVTINAIQPSCGCTTAKAPPMPWKLKPGESGSFDLSMNLAGKGGEVSKPVTINSSSGFKSLIIKVSIPPAAGVAASGAMGDQDRLNNMKLAMQDRQVLFKGECASCHADPAKGKEGHQLFAAVCSTCHDSPHRASIVPDLKVRHPATPEAWREWIGVGKAGSLMPAFAQEKGGPLTKEQVESLVSFLSATYPGAPQPAAGAPTAVPVKPINTGQVIPQSGATATAGLSPK